MSSESIPDLAEWTSALLAELGLADAAADCRVDLLLAAARDAAHRVTRPAAPVTTFLVGYAAARAGGGVEAVERAVGTAQQLAARWPTADGPGGEGSGVGEGGRGGADGPGGEGSEGGRGGEGSRAGESSRGGEGGPGGEGG